MNLRIDERVSSVKEIDFRRLIAQGKRVFIFDFDNTLGLWKTGEIVSFAVDALRLVSELGGEVFIISNGKPRKLPLEFPVIWRAFKPLPFKVLWKLRHALRDRGKVVVIGDQLFTDVLFGNFIRAYTVKVEPLDRDRECISTKILRFFERFFVNLRL